MNEKFEDLKFELSSRVLYLNDLPKINEFCDLLNKMIIDFDYKLDEIDYFILAVKYYYTMELETALIYTNKILEINPKFIRAYNLKALIYLKLKHYQEALNCIEEGLDIENDAKRILLPNKAAILSEMGFYNEALEIYNIILEENPNDFYSLTGKSILLYKLGRINEAKEFVDKALEINPDYISGLLHKARLMLEIDPNESIRICDEIIKKNINLGEAYYIKSCAYALLRDKKNAILNLRKAIETNIEYKFLAMDDRDFEYIKDDEEFYLTIHS
jgi:tetratricopeptide (TPR) repeat protein